MTLKAHKPLQWQKRDDMWFAGGVELTYFIYRYKIAGQTTWCLQATDEVGGYNNNLDDLKNKAQRHYDNECQRKAWEDYMLSHDPPDN